MPTISKGDYILVTGASGFIAVHTVLAFLDAGYRVRGTVRSKSKGDYLVKLFTAKGHQGKFDYVLVDDITKPNAFDEAVKDIDAVAHLASPFYVSGVKDPQELIHPAIEGTVGVLKSVQKVNPKIKRVVITSSFYSMINMDSNKSPYHYTEKDWNVDSPAHVEKNGANSYGGHSYAASKTLAERAFWKFLQDEKPSWDGATINPPYVIGAILQECETPEKLNTSVAIFYQWAAGNRKEADLPGAPEAGSWVDVSDVALAHVRALEVPEASGQRFSTSAGAFTPQDYVDVLHKDFPDLKNVPVGKTNAHDEYTKDMDFVDGSKAEKVLGIKYKSFEQTVVEMCKSVRERFGF
ncbi:methylglyoxal reductase (NADPH-dependent) gre2 [Saitozyma podzolica]|uniref:Methylglyoxal reductase (NADPH-dependent) gre2 n=1 Tax=Saitozyma podzolica TaxID=1890683 RepID=A0A427YCJ7_9TREE|nr:methylglyoxal reductase (NADPH-dependent) gre2 [Saitozyma podzolica]